MDSIEIICAHVLDTEHADLSDEAVRWSRIFLLDSLGVGVSGSSGPWVDALARSQASAHLAERTAGARVLGSDQRLSAQGAALLNAYQIHNAEYDCVHEGAVVHPMAVLLGATLAAIDDGALFAQPVDGRSLLSAVALGVDVAATLGLAARSGLRFFRPATAGAFAATAAIGRLAGFDRPTLVSAMGISLSQLCGTMQAHSEGSPLLAMQVGFNARNAVLACELARAGVPGPGAVLDGPYAYFELFEAEHDYADLLQQLGHCWRITEVAHKPFPSGRATHGIVDACLEIGAHHDLRSVAIERVVARVPPLTRRLVGRPVKPDMAVNYARLCAQYVVARVLQRGELDLSDFSIEALRDEATLALAQRVEVVEQPDHDPNALTPVTVEIRLADGTRLERSLDVIYGNPARPMSAEARTRKLAHCWQHARLPLAEDGPARLQSMVDALEELADVRVLLDLCTACS